MNGRHGDHGLGENPDIDRAWAFVIEHQGAQDRKAPDGTEPAPYTRHLRAVAQRVQDGGGSVQETIAGLLHDVVEDTPVREGDRSIALEDVAEEFGERVAEIVGFCTDTGHDGTGAAEPGEQLGPGGRGAKAPWRVRKEAHFTKVAAADAGTLRVVVADKTDNITGQIAGLRACEGDPGSFAEYVSRFKGGFAGTLWYYRGMHAAMGQTLFGLDQYQHFTECIEEFATLWTPSADELRRRERVLNVLATVDPSGVGVGRIRDGYYRIDADELARRASAPEAGSTDEIVREHIARWYRPKGGPDAHAEALSGKAHPCGWDEQGEIELVAAALQRPAG